VTSFLVLLQLKLLNIMQLKLFPRLHVGYLKSNGRPERSVFSVARRVRSQIDRMRHFVSHMTSQTSINSSALQSKPNILDKISTIFE